MGDDFIVVKNGSDWYVYRRVSRDESKYVTSNESYYEPFADLGDRENDAYEMADIYSKNELHKKREAGY